MRIVVEIDGVEHTVQPEQVKVGSLTLDDWFKRFTVLENKFNKHLVDETKKEENLKKLWGTLK